MDLIGKVLNSPLDRLHLVIATRDPGNIQLSRLRAQDAFQTIDIRDLGFTVSETKEFFESVNEIQLEPEEISLVRERTEGWVAGLQLAAIAIRHSQSRAQFLSTFSGEHSSVADFLADEVLRQQSVETRNFLLATSILERFNAPLGAAVSGIPNAQELLNRLESANLFIFALDEKRNWYRYHRLFSELLRTKLKEESPELLATLHTRASEWYSQHGLDFQAIEHAFAAGNLARAASLLEASSHRLFSSGQNFQLYSLTSRLPPETLDQLPNALLDQAWHLELCWKFDKARITLDRARKALGDRASSGNTSDGDGDLTFLTGKLAHREMMLAIASDDTQLAAHLASKWLEDYQIEEPFLRGSCGTVIMLGKRERYDCDGALQWSKVLREIFIECGALYGFVYHECTAGGTFFMQGHLDAADESYRRAQDMANKIHGERSALAGFPGMMRADLHYERNELAAADELLGFYDISADLGLADKLVSGFMARAKLPFATGEREDAEAALEDATYFAAEYGFDRLHAHIYNERVRQLIADGQIKAAAKTLSDPKHRTLLDVSLRPRDGVTVTVEQIALANARVWMMTGRAPEAISLLKQWADYLRNRRCPRAAVRINVLLARAYLVHGNRRAAQRALIDALKFGSGKGFVRSFLDESAEVVELLDELRSTDVAQHELDAGYVRDIFTAWRAPSTPAPEATSIAESSQLAPLAEELTDRELQILRLGAQGLSNQDISDALCLANTTVKWYWQRIFYKFDVRRRSDAIKSARQHHLVR